MTSRLVLGTGYIQEFKREDKTQHPHQSLVTQQETKQMSVHVSRPHTTHYCVTFPGERQTNVYSPRIRGTDLIGQRTNFT